MNGMIVRSPGRRESTLQLPSASQYPVEKFKRSENLLILPHGYGDDTSEYSDSDNNEGVDGSE